MAFTSVTTKITTAWNATELVQILSGGAGFGDVIFAGDLPFGSAHIVQTSGTAITSFQLFVANDGLLTAGSPPTLTNGVKLGPSMTGAGFLPNMMDLATGSIVATGPGIAPTGGWAQTPYKYFQFQTVGGDATSVITISMVFMGTRG